MAERKASKPQKATPSGASPRGRPSAAKGSPPRSKPTPQPTSKAAATPRDLQTLVEHLETQVSGLTRERDALAKDLAVARAEIAALEKARRDAINRIDWVIDSLQTLLRDKT